MRADLGALTITQPPLIVIRNQAVRKHLDLPDYIGALMPHCSMAELRDIVGDFTLDEFNVSEEELELPIRVAIIMALPDTEQGDTIAVH